MNTQTEKEIDLSQIANKIGSFFQNLAFKFFSFLLFVKKNILVFIALFIIGVVLGYFYDKSAKGYKHQIIVTPNFGSVDYLYAKIDLLEAKIAEGDTLFLKQLNIKNSKKFNDISIEPIIDVYKFIEGRADNFELIKLMAEDGDIDKIIEDKVTSKNYPYHLIEFKTSKKTTVAETLDPILDYLNQSEYFQKNQKQYLYNLDVKEAINDSLVVQIDAFLAGLSTGKNGSKSSSLVYYNENTQLNEVFKTKEALLSEKNRFNLERISLDKIIKDTSVTLNLKEVKPIYTKAKVWLPIIFWMLFLAYVNGKSFYKKQMNKRK